MEAINITRETTGRFNPDNFVIGSTVSSLYIPTICLNESKKISERKHVIYNKPKFKIERYGSRNSLDWKRVYINLFHSLSLNRHKVKEEDENLDIYIGKNYITDMNNNIFLTLCIKRNYENYTSANEDLVLLVSRRLLLEKEYSTFYKKLEKEYITPANIKGIEVIFTDEKKIEKLCFSNPFEMNFNNITELNNYLIDSVQHIPYAKDSYFVQNAPMLDCNIPNHNFYQRDYNDSSDRLQRESDVLNRQRELDVQVQQALQSRPSSMLGYSLERTIMDIDSIPEMSTIDVEPAIDSFNTTNLHWTTPTGEERGSNLGLQHPSPVDNSVNSDVAVTEDGQIPMSTVSLSLAIHPPNPVSGIPAFGNYDATVEPNNEAPYGNEDAEY